MALPPGIRHEGDLPRETSAQGLRHRQILIEDSIAVAQLLRKRQIIAIEAAEPTVIESEIQETVVQYNDFPNAGTDSTEVLFDVDPVSRSIRAYVPSSGGSGLSHPQVLARGLGA